MRGGCRHVGPFKTWLLAFHAQDDRVQRSCRRCRLLLCRPLGLSYLVYGSKYRILVTFFRRFDEDAGSTRIWFISP